MARIGMLLADRDVLPDIRIDKEAAALLAHGHTVGLLAGGTGEGDGSAPAPPGVEIHRSATPILSVAGLSPRPKPRLLWRLAGAPGGSPADLLRATGIEGVRFWPRKISGPWAHTIQRFVADFAPDILHAHDLLVLPTALAVAAKHDLPLVADLHENWPATLELFRRERPGWYGRLFGRWWEPDRWRALEVRLLRRCAGIIVVTLEAAERLESQGIAADQIIVVSNTLPAEEERLDSEIIARYAGRWVASYVGGVAAHRGVEDMVHAVPAVARRHPAFLLLVVGANAEWNERLMALARELGVATHVEVLPWAAPAQIPSYIAASRVGLVPHRASEHTQTTLPHKLFQYMGRGKPVLVSDLRPLRRVVQKSDSGLIFTPGEPASAAAMLRRLIKDSTLASRLGTNGRRAARDEYAWENDAQRLLELYRHLGCAALGI